ncbi:MAG: pyruvate kinase [Baekduia sp.]|nr:pyruvate kinase [Baekduia sp.]
MPDALRRKTKIVAPLGPATDAPGVLDGLVAAGLDCARLNCSHGTGPELVERAEAVRAAAARAGRPIGVLFDLQGPKLRLSASTSERRIGIGESMTFSSNRSSGGVLGHATVDCDGFARLVTSGSEIVIGDGVPRFAVEHARGETVTARAVSAGAIAPRKGVNVIRARPELPAITDKDVDDLNTAMAVGADFVALSFVRSAADIEELRQRLRAGGSRAAIVAKIETVEAYERIDEIIAAADGVMVARGDFGVTAGLARVPLMQKDTIWRATQAGKFVITATQMFESMIQAPEPTRAEVADVANAVIDGTSAVMLSAETGVGRHPVDAVRMMSLVAQAAEETPVVHGRARVGEHPGDTSAEGVMHAAVLLADQLRARLLVIPTATGGAVRACAKFRLRTPMLALAHDPVVAAQLTTEWGVQPLYVEVGGSPHELAEHALDIARDTCGLASGDHVVVTVGPQAFSPGATNVIVVRELP